ncbi:MAG: transglutaminase domain-containing protein [Chloroflexi bacterium]|nr:transglutaminase domain-containing protein [Chloroflexota bacterium]
MKTDILQFYTRHTRFTDPGEYANHLKALPAGMDALHSALSGLLMPIWKVQKHHPELVLARPEEIKTRHIRRSLEAMLAIDDRPLNVARDESRRLIVDCRHFAALLCAVLRQRGIPARSRWGFATYLEKTHYQNHCLCEYWSAKEGRWVLEDPDLQMQDVAPEQFITAGRAWQMCREDRDNGALFGFGRHPRGLGLSNVRGILVSDFAALNGFEMLSDDWWGMHLKNNKDVTKDDTAVLDRAAILAITEESFAERRELYQNCEALRVPPVIETHAPGSSRHVGIEWRKEA